LLDGNIFSGKLSRASGETIGSYPINAGILSAGTNYDINFLNKDFSITSKALSVNNPTLTTSKTYNGATIASVTASALQGLVSGDEANVSISAVANYNNKNVGSGKTITVIYSLSGSASSNYTKPVDYTISNGEIIAKQLTISNPTVTTNKMYDGNTTAMVQSVGILSGVEPADVNNVSIIITANYNNATAGSSKIISVVYTLSGSAATNYITPATLLINNAKISEKIVLNTLQQPASSCEDSDLELNYTASAGTPVRYQIIFADNAHSVGFQDIAFTDLTSSGNTGIVTIPIPLGTQYGTYQASLQLSNELGKVSEVYPFQFVVNVSSDFIITKFDDVVLCDNSSNNFSSYQWYKNGIAIEGATRQFYNDKNGLVGSYSLKVKTIGGQDLYSCPKILNITKAKKVSVGVYPNPMRANQASTVKITGMSDDELQGAVMSVYNIQGIKVYSTQNVQQNNTLILQNLDGSYVGHIITAKGNDYVYRILLVK
ncbi:MAG: T9SS type A sorting domain-containing protein, partial [Mariniphaga sp.]|nr:T9SS type A sorting domain-containing protein [Mariniphaga sp.]